MDRGRRALPMLNKHTDFKYYKKCQNIHKKKLNNIRSCIDNGEPVRPNHLRNNRKKQQMREERDAKTERENRILLGKMSYIMQHNTLDNKSGTIRSGRSLNTNARKKDLQRITAENQAILGRIQTQEATYDRSHWVEHARASEKYSQNIREYPANKKGTKSTGNLRNASLMN